MRVLAFCFLALSLCCSPQSAQSTGNAESKGPCSPPISGSRNTVILKCAVDAQRGREMQALLNKILVNQLPADLVMSKLDEILANVDPNKATVVYTCNGSKRTQGPSAGGGTATEVSLDKREIDDLNAMSRYFDSNDWISLLNRCQSVITSSPGWLTSRLFCAAAESGLNEQGKARAYRDYYDRHVGPAYDGDPFCRSLRGVLNKPLTQ